MSTRTSRRLSTATLVVLMALMAPEVFAQRERPRRPPKGVKAPEIDPNAGTKGIAVLVAGFLLVGEQLRRRS